MLHVPPKWREQVADAVFAKLTNSNDWNRELDCTGTISHYLGSRDLAAYFNKQYVEFRGILTALGLAR